MLILFVVCYEFVSCYKKYANVHIFWICKGFNKNILVDILG
jgi:hypothetical protein